MQDDRVGSPKQYFCVGTCSIHNILEIATLLSMWQVSPALRKTSRKTRHKFLLKKHQTMVFGIEMSKLADLVKSKDIFGKRVFVGNI